MDSDALSREVMRGREAAQLLEHPLLVEAFASIRKDLHGNWMAAPVRDAEGRERIWLMTKMLERLESAIRMHVDTGKMAARQITDLEEKKKRPLGLW